MTPVVRAVRAFAQDMSREPLCHCGYGDAWALVAKADGSEVLLAALGYCAGYADRARIANVFQSPAWQRADIVGLAAKTFLVGLRGTKPVDLDACARVYRAELLALLAHDAGAAEVAP